MGWIESCAIAAMNRLVAYSRRFREAWAARSGSTSAATMRPEGVRQPAGAFEVNFEQIHLGVLTATFNPNPWCLIRDKNNVKGMRL